MNANKLQSLLITYLQKHGAVKLLLPDGVILEIGVNQLDNHGNLKKTDNYCWVMASQDDRMAILDSYNLGVRFSDKRDVLILEDKMVTEEGESVRLFDVV